MEDSQVKIELARLDERIKAYAVLLEANQKNAADNLEIARTELARRLDILNGEHERFGHVTALMTSRDLFDALVTRVTQIELDAREQRGKLWFPMLIASAAAAGIGAGIAKLL